jgi:methionine-S-sulfoxide reductase
LDQHLSIKFEIAMFTKVHRIALAILAIAALAGAASADFGSKSSVQKAAMPGLAEATFAAGCFWCVESDFEKLDGVVEAVSGYTGGKTKNPTYDTVGRGGSGHVEAVRVKYDSSKISYRQLLDHYWRNVDLLDGDGQFCDRGAQYRPVIFTHDAEQQRLAEDSKAALESSGRFSKPIAVAIVPVTEFTAAEEEHQNYAKNNPLRYRYYRYGCRRDARLEQLWGSEAGH